MESHALHQNTHISKATKKHILFPYFHKAVHPKEKTDSKPPIPTHKRSESKVTVSVNSSILQKKIPKLKPRERGKSISVNCVVHTPRKFLKEDNKENKAPKNSNLKPRTKKKNPIYSCAPSPVLSRSAEEIIVPWQEKKPLQENEKKKRLNLLHLNHPVAKEPVPLAKDVKNIPKEKKRVRLYRVDRFAKLRPENLVQEDPFQNQPLIVNPAIEQELFKEYLGTNKQTFEFEKLVLLGGSENPPNSTCVLTPQIKTNTDSTPALKAGKMETKLTTVTRASSNTLAALTTNSSSRYKGTLGVMSGISDRENLDLVELIDWSIDIECSANMNSGLKSPTHSYQNSHFEVPKAEIQKINTPKMGKRLSKAMITPQALISALSQSNTSKGKLNRISKKKD